jgi:hypothetical protein
MPVLLLALKCRSISKNRKDYGGHLLRAPKLRRILTVILRSRALARRLEGWPRVMLVMSLVAHSFVARRYAASTSG